MRAERSRRYFDSESLAGTLRAEASTYALVRGAMRSRICLGRGRRDETCLEEVEIGKGSRVGSGHQNDDYEDGGGERENKGHKLEDTKDRFGSHSVVSAVPGVKFATRHSRCSPRRRLST